MTEGSVLKPLCIDTSFLIDLWEEFHDPHRFPDLWNDVIPGLIKEGVFFAPREVFEELSNKASGLRKWASKNREMFRLPDREACIVLREILRNDPGCVDIYRRGPHADALVVAMAKSSGAIAVTRERRDGGNIEIRKTRIPRLCTNNEVECFVTVREFREHINWPTK